MCFYHFVFSHYAILPLKAGQKWPFYCFGRSNAKQVHSQEWQNRELSLTISLKVGGQSTPSIILFKW